MVPTGSSPIAAGANHQPAVSMKVATTTPNAALTSGRYQRRKYPARSHRSDSSTMFGSSGVQPSMIRLTLGPDGTSIGGPMKGRLASCRA